MHANFYGYWIQESQSKYGTHSYEIHKYMYMYNHVFDILHMQALHKWDDS